MTTHYDPRRTHNAPESPTGDSKRSQGVPIPWRSHPKRRVGNQTTFSQKTDSDPRPQNVTVTHDFSAGIESPASRPPRAAPGQRFARAVPNGFRTGSIIAPQRSFPIISDHLRSPDGPLHPSSPT